MIRMGEVWKMCCNMFDITSVKVDFSSHQALGLDLFKESYGFLY